MSKETVGLIRFTVMFFENHCMLHSFRSRLPKITSLSYGFQAERQQKYSFKALLNAISEKKFVYGSKLGLFVQNNKTQKQESFYIELPHKHPEAQADVIVDVDDYKIDITELLERLSQQ
jgi:hypothetical protein